ncbi:hypothetical protein M0R19_04740 [Candidatus Pacearchaeota archaeon]|jgi:hypothetical protein|nr:hypothetical protein [Candidatus Pacearchaeota archaeon]
MTAIDATWSSSGATAYIDVTDASSYIATNVLGSSIRLAWATAATVDQEVSLLRAAKAIDAFHWHGNKKYDYQALAFPRSSKIGGNSSWPWSLSVTAQGTLSQEEELQRLAVRAAACQQAAYLIGSLSAEPDEHIQNQRRGISSYSESLGGKLSESFSYKTVASRLCQEAMELLKDYTGSGPTLERG